MQKIDDLLDEACDLALIEVERIARKILNKNKSFNEFVMAMGTYSFTTKKNDDIDDDDSRISELVEFIDEFNRYLYITGNPMRFTAKGEKITNW